MFCMLIPCVVWFISCGYFMRYLIGRFYIFNKKAINYQFALWSVRVLKENCLSKCLLIMHCIYQYLVDYVNLLIKGT